MSDGSDPLKILIVLGQTSAQSTTRVVAQNLADRLTSLGAQVDYFDYQQDPLPLMDVTRSFSDPIYQALKPRVVQADAFVFATPDYHGSMSSALKNFLDHFWKEFAGKLVGTIVGSHDKGLTVMDQVRTVLRQCYAWPLPYGVAFVDKTDVQDGAVESDALKGRLEMMAHDLLSYGRLLRRQRQQDLAGTHPGFLAHYRS